VRARPLVVVKQARERRQRARPPPESVASARLVVVAAPRSAGRAARWRTPPGFQPDAARQRSKSHTPTKCMSSRTPCH
jgi:hypothetical protein